MASINFILTLGAKQMHDFIKFQVFDEFIQIFGQISVADNVVLQMQVGVFLKDFVNRSYCVIKGFHHDEACHCQYFDGSLSDRILPST